MEELTELPWALHDKILNVHDEYWPLNTQNDLKLIKVDHSTIVSFIFFTPAVTARGGAHPGLVARPIVVETHSTP